MNLAQTLTELNKGALVAELGDKLSEAVAAVKEHGGKARLRFDLKIAKISDDAVELSPEVTLTKPTKPKRPSVYYANEKGELSRDPFEQQELPLPSVVADHSLISKPVPKLFGGGHVLQAGPEDIDDRRPSTKTN